ncbi:MAG: nitrate reductase molybdenum cofactor assembly chaperone [Candidatus Acidiferrales bacterium]
MSAYLLFAEVLDYPGPELSRRVSELACELAIELPQAEGLIKTFQGSHESMGTAKLQEIYTRTFDMQPDCTPNLGYHLFGEDQRRGVFLAKLNELYQQAKVDTGNELPDHVCFLLRYLATGLGTEETTDIITDCLLPAVSKIAHRVDAPSNPYRGVLDALLLWLEKESGGLSMSGEMNINKTEAIAGRG